MTASPFKPLFAAIIPLTLITTEIGHAQETTQEATTPAVTTPGTLRSFESDYFSQYAPSTALDMLQRVPGFQLQGGNTDRGLGQGGANVLLNGSQITGKGNDAFSQVGRVSASSVTRIDIVDGASLDIPGLSGQVANVISSNTGITGTWEWRPEWRPEMRGNILPFKATISGETGNLNYSAELKNDSFRNGHWGPEKQFDGAGNLLRVLDEKSTYHGDNPGGSVNLTWKPKEGHAGHLNLEYNKYNFNRAQTSIINPEADPNYTGIDTFEFAEDEWNGKIDGDYELPFLDGKLKAIGYYRFERSETYARSKHFALSAALEDHGEYHQVADEGEAIGRTEYSWSPSEGRDWQLALEGAYNYLDIGATFFDFTNDGEFPNASRVEELRSEGTITHTRTLSPKWDLQVSLGGEYSEISQGPQTRDFIRPKGFVSTTYKPSDDFSIRTKIEREVGQLNFFDFVDSVSLEDNFNSAGNSNLVPSQSWNGEIEFDKQFSGGHSLKARFYGELISDLVDRVPIGIDGDAVGNIDDASRYGVEINSTIKGDDIGLAGMELNTEFQLRDSSVDDPLGGFSRRLNDDLKSFWSVSFRHDIPNTDLAWGFYSDQFKESEVYRLNTISQFTFNGPWAHAFVEHKDVFGMKVNASVRNLFAGSDDFERTVFDGRRDIGEVIRFEDQSREFGGLFFRLVVSGTF